LNKGLILFELPLLICPFFVSLHFLFLIIIIITIIIIIILVLSLFSKSHQLLIVVEKRFFVDFLLKCDCVCVRARVSVSSLRASACVCVCVYACVCDGTDLLMTSQFHRFPNDSHYGESKTIRVFVCISHHFSLLPLPYLFLPLFRCENKLKLFLFLYFIYSFYFISIEKGKKKFNNEASVFFSLSFTWLVFVACADTVKNI